MALVLSKKSVAQMMGKSERWVGKLMEEGLPYTGGGKGNPVEIDSEAFLDWYIRREVRRHIGDDDEDEDGTGSASTEDRMLKKVRREKLEIEVERLRGNLVPLDAVIEIMTRYAAIFASQLDSLPSRVASDMAVIEDPAEARHRLLEEVRRVRATTADGLVAAARGLAEQVDRFDPLDVEPDNGAAAEDG